MVTADLPRDSGQRRITGKDGVDGKLRQAGRIGYIGCCNPRWLPQIVLQVGMDPTLEK